MIHDSHQEQMEAARKDFDALWDGQLKTFISLAPAHQGAIVAAKHVAWNSFLFGLGITRRNNRIADKGPNEETNQQ
jgi:hypothetical protein